MANETIQNYQAQETIKEIIAKPVEKQGSYLNWLSIQITLWPFIILIIFIVFRKQIRSILSQISEFSFGSLSIKLRKRLKISKDKYIKIQNLTARDIKFFFVVASQSWKIESVKWKLDIKENLALHIKLEDAGLISIKNKNTAVSDKNVDCELTSLGEDLYSELTSLISESIK